MIVRSLALRALLLTALGMAACAPPGAWLGEPPPGGDDGVTPNRPDELGVVPRDEPEGYVLGPEEITVFVGEDLALDLRLAEPELFGLRAGSVPPSATYTELPTGGELRWTPLGGDIGTHDVVLLIVDRAEPNLVIAQEMLVIDVIPRQRFVEYGF